MRYERVLSEETTDRIVAAPEAANVASEEPERSLSLGERMRSPQTIASFLVAFAILFFVFRQLDINFGNVWRQVRSASPAWLGLAFLAYYGSFPIRAMRWRILLRNASISRADGHDIPNVVGMSEIYVLSWFVNCVVPAKLGDAYRGYLLKKNAGPSFSRTLGTIFAERLLDIVALVALMVVSGLVVFHGTVPASVRWWFGAGAGLVVVGIGGLIALMTASHRIEALIPSRARPYWGRLSEGIVTSFSRNGFWSVAALTATIWFLEGARVYFVARALDVELGVGQAVFVALLASLLTTFPFTPAGAGVVEGGIVIALKLFDITADHATAVALVDRLVASYSVVVIGGLLYFISRRK